MKLVLDSTRSAGFDTFDSVVVEYYTEEFEKGTNVHNAQKMSRHRHLPNVLRSLRHSAGQWTQWEAGGYKGEIIRSAETILVEEFERLMHNQMVGACSENDTSSAASGNLSPRPSPTGSSTDSEPTSILNGTLKIEDEVRGSVLFMCSRSWVDLPDSYRICGPWSSRLLQAAPRQRRAHDIKSCSTVSTF
jgi:hypothetical protein